MTKPITDDFDHNELPSYRSSDLYQFRVTKEEVKRWWAELGGTVSRPAIAATMLMVDPSSSLPPVAVDDADVVILRKIMDRMRSTNLDTPFKRRTMLREAFGFLEPPLPTWVEVGGTLFCSLSRAHHQVTRIDATSIDLDPWPANANPLTIPAGLVPLFCQPANPALGIAGLPCPTCKDRFDRHDKVGPGPRCFGCHPPEDGMAHERRSMAMAAFAKGNRLLIEVDDVEVEAWHGEGSFRTYCVGASGRRSFFQCFRKAQDAAAFFATLLHQLEHPR